MNLEIDGQFRNPFRPGLHILAIGIVCAVFPLLLVGAGVTSKDAGMAYPGWPTSDGYLLNPPRWWETDLTRWEHGHRLIGWVVGILAIGLSAASWRAGAPLRALGLVTLMAIVVQGVLGGVRVLLTSTTLAMFHGIWGQICFCLAAVAALMSGKTWVTAGIQQVRHAHILQRLCLITTGAVFVQLILGAAQRHFGSDALLVGHVLWAIVVIFLVGWVSLWVIQQYPDQRLINRLAMTMGVLTVVQLFLGGLAFLVTVMGAFSTPLLLWLIPSAHVGAGAVLLACSVCLTLSTYRLFETARERRRVVAVAELMTT